MRQGFRVFALIVSAGCFGSGSNERVYAVFDLDPTLDALGPDHAIRFCAPDEDGRGRAVAGDAWHRWDGTAYWDEEGPRFVTFVIDEAWELRADPAEAGSLVGGGHILRVPHVESPIWDYAHTLHCP